MDWSYIILTMTTATEPFRRSPFSGGDHNPSMQRSIPILPSTSANQSASTGVDAMDLTPSHTSSSSSMGPPVLSSPNGDRHEHSVNGGSIEHPTTNGGVAPAVGAAAVAQQPKVVQTAFIHKLYKFVTSILGIGPCILIFALVCWKINRYSISYPGLTPMKASLCLLPTNFRKFWRK